ncbi:MULTISPECIES: DUF2225 domain-containing protein [unclassified Paenibacillus]|uniref:DUF2225 domain-containing protein n=1 Tax=unclassified Paenibacillus TaxID=185978 RepID=UPI002404CF05|nr:MULTISPECIES: DUF2225 domain-containing protein [unclassified Paenibacillus]MDF9842778.1 uncharacterized protein (DUF2225 family) [Paenibacillus sp. PastF-2]MDF9849354.1 uncharacterized protein (DUF2225 family) [Paenibacillus sp. PastM-2]MDF9855938.1 uncharacterized protein (DUF2225 family) [Paenibacillus sp. PastF-1]MDH6481195.1 uncharacterized protein (DUF2225 family) [Paenibacillus sp. PastH-2]MDH6508615.1 uncharacterized protein (DUF2225 family) [Paenibacillus sp. PastM-3]
MSELIPLYSIKVICIHCENEFFTSRVRPSLKRAIRRDADFCSYYKDENPDYYVVRICPNCGFASTENSADKLADWQRKAFKEQVASRWQSRDFGGKRSWETALETYKLALICSQCINDKSRIVASHLHHIAWMYRYKGDTEQEQRFLRYSLDEYIKVFENDGMGGNDARLMFLIGELNRRVGEYNKAVRWFSRLINDQRIMDAAMIRSAREQWALLREQMRGEDTEPDGMPEGANL